MKTETLSFLFDLKNQLDRLPDAPTLDVVIVAEAVEYTSKVHDELSALEEKKNEKTIDLETAKEKNALLHQELNGAQAKIAEVQKNYGHLFARSNSIVAYYAAKHKSIAKKGYKNKDLEGVFYRIDMLSNALQRTNSLAGCTPFSASNNPVADFAGAMVQETLEKKAALLDEIITAYQDMSTATNQKAGRFALYNAITKAIPYKSKS